jgi:hypothetical protein
MARPKKIKCFTRVQVYLPADLLLELQIGAKINNMNISRYLRNVLNNSNLPIQKRIKTND